EARAAAALDRDAENLDLGLLGEELLDLRRRGLGEREQRRGRQALLNLRHPGHRSNVFRGSQTPDFVTPDSRLTTRFLSVFVPVNRREGSRCWTTGCRSSSMPASRFSSPLRWC